MVNTIKTIIFILNFILSSAAFARYNEKAGDLKLKDDNSSLFSFGGGASYFETSYVLSPGISIEIGKIFHISNSLISI